jgi:hypothetical protein
MDLDRLDPEGYIRPEADLAKVQPEYQGLPDATVGLLRPTDRRNRPWSVRTGSVPQRSRTVTSGHSRFIGTAGRRPSSSRSRDDVGERFGLWSRRSEVGCSSSQKPAWPARQSEP